MIVKCLINYNWYLLDQSFAVFSLRNVINIGKYGIKFANFRKRERKRDDYIESDDYDIPCVYTVWQYPNSRLPSALASPSKRECSINQ